MSEERIRKLASEFQQTNPRASYEDALRWARERVKVEEAEEERSPDTEVPVRPWVEDRPWIGAMVHAHEDGDCSPAIVRARTPAIGGVNLVFFTGAGPDYYGQSGIPYRRYPRNRDGRLSWHWPERCPFDR